MMKSAIQTALLAACGLAAADFKDRRAMHVAIVEKVNDFDDAQWDALKPPEQDWFNDAADAVKAKKTPAEFPDAVDEPETRSRRRASAEPEQQPAAGAETAVDKLEEGDRVKITFKKRGDEKTASGEVVEISKRKGYVVVKGADGEDVEIDFTAVTATEVFHGNAGGEEAEDAIALAVGAEIEFVTKRGKSVAGVVKELHDDFLVLANGDDYDLDKIDGEIKVTAAAPAPSPAPSGRRGGAAPSPAPAPAEGEKPQRSSNPKGVSVGGRIRELLAKNPDMAQAAVGEVLTKENIEFRDTTLNMIYKDCVAFIANLRDAGQMKKAK